MQWIRVRGRKKGLNLTQWFSIMLWVSVNKLNNSVRSGDKMKLSFTSFFLESKKIKCTQFIYVVNTNIMICILHFKQHFLKWPLTVLCSQSQWCWGVFSSYFEGVVILFVIAIHSVSLNPAGRKIKQTNSTKIKWSSARIASQLEKLQFGSVVWD